MGKVYLFKDDMGQYAGYTDSKSVKKALLSERKNYSCIKVDIESVKNLTCGDIIQTPLFAPDRLIDANYEYYCGYGGYIVNGYEEEQFISSFEQFKSDFAYTNVNMLKNIMNIIKLTKKERMILSKFFKITDMYQDAYIHGTLEEEPEAEFEAFKYDRAMESFLVNSLGVELRKKSNNERK